MKMERHGRHNALLDSEQSPETLQAFDRYSARSVRLFTRVRSPEGIFHDAALLVRRIMMSLNMAVYVVLRRATHDEA